MALQSLTDSLFTCTYLFSPKYVILTLLAGIFPNTSFAPDTALSSVQHIADTQQILVIAVEVEKGQHWVEMPKKVSWLVLPRVAFF